MKKHKIASILQNFVYPLVYSMHTWETGVLSPAHIKSVKF